MRSQSLVEEQGLGRRVTRQRSSEWSVFPGPGRPVQAEGVDGSSEYRAEWERHVVIGLWIFVAVLVTATAALLYGDYHGLLGSAPNQPQQVPSWPIGWP